MCARHNCSRRATLVERGHAQNGRVLEDQKVRVALTLVRLSPPSLSARESRTRLISSHLDMSHNAHPSSQPVPPMDISELHQIVAASASQDPSVMLAASTRLKDALKIPGTLNELHNIASNRDLPLPIRQLCMLQCKNEMPTQWRQRKYALRDIRAYATT